MRSPWQSAVDGAPDAAGPEGHYPEAGAPRFSKDNMLGSPAQEAEIMEQVLSFRADPVNFVLWSYPWGQPGTPLENIKGPRDWQLEELEAIGKHVQEQEFRLANDLPLAIWRSAYSSGRGPGKSALLGMIAHWQISTHLGSTAIVAANTENQLRTKTFPEFAVWFGSAVNRHWFTIETLRIVPQPWLTELMRKPREEGGLEIDPKKWACYGQTWTEDNPSAFAGEHNPRGLVVLFDEAAGIHSGVWDTTDGFFTEINPYRFWLGASQMRRRSGRMFELFNDKQIGHGWRCRTLSTRGMAGVDQTLIEDQIRRYGADSDFVRVEIDGLAPRTSEDQFIPWDAVRAAQQNNLGYDYGEALVLGIDPAPRGKTAWRFRQGRNARDCCGPATYGSWDRLDNVQIAQKILDLDAKYRPDFICIDFGMGTGVIDILRRKTLNARLLEVRFGDTAHDGKESEYATHAIELWARVRDWLPGGMVEKDSGEKGTLSFQATNRGWRWSGREDNKKILETKEDLQKRGVASPDDMDALACTFENKDWPRPHRQPGGQPTGGFDDSDFFK
jgi:hypothetical protein